jgi:hypothetical protein
MFLRSTSFGRLNKREDLCYASKLIRIFGPQSLYPLNPLPDQIPLTIKHFL